MEYCVHADDGDLLFGEERGCAAFEQRVLRFDEPSDERVNDRNDEVLYVLAGSGSATVGNERVGLVVGTAAYIGAGTAWRVDEAAELELVSVLVRDPVPGGEPLAIVDVSRQATGDATAGRAFRLLATPEVGCASVTQFVGYIPVGRAPDHFHKYDEVVYVLDGEGALHIDGETAPLRAGSAVHLPAGLVHCLENVGPGVMQVLGVFRPAGSPAEAYYPDGVQAQY